MANPRLPCTAAVVWTCLGGAMLAVNGQLLPPLPQWDEEQLENWELFPPELGKHLFRDDSETLEIPNAAEMALPEDMVLPKPLGVDGIKDLSDDLVGKYFPEGGQEVVIDPQELLTRSRMDGILNFLEYHHREARSRLRILVLGPNQRFPNALDLQAMHEEWFPEGLGVIVIYNFGNPEMSRLVFDEITKQRVDDARCSRACMESINDAIQVADHEEQLERFLMELSRQLYWIEAIYYGAETPVPVMQQAEKNQDLEAAAEARVRKAVKERVLITLACSLLGVIGVGALIVFLQRRASQRTYYFPERKWHTRLGAPYGGGNRVVVSFDETVEKIS